MTKAAVSGSFNRLHKGHKLLIDRAFELGDEIYIGVTTDEFASNKKVGLRPFEDRLRDVEKYVIEKGKPYYFMTVTNALEIEKMKDMDVLIVSQETKNNGVAIVELLKTKGKNIKLITVPLVLSKNGNKISSTDIINGLYNEDGV